MPKPPKDPDNPLRSSGQTITVKLSDAFYERLAGRAIAWGITRSELARNLMERGEVHLAVEQGPAGNVEDDRSLLEQRMEYALMHLEAVLTEHAPADPAGAVVMARGGARFLAQWADERALRAGLVLPAMEGV